MAVGAQRWQIGTHFLSLGLRLLAAGTILGLLGAWWTGRAMQSVLFDVPTLPLATLLGTALVMSVVSLVACLIPARRATKVDPMIALRAE
jgi:putative ABC transport system permease protein